MKIVLLARLAVAFILVIVSIVALILVPHSCRLLLESLTNLGMVLGV